MKKFLIKIILPSFIALVLLLSLGEYLLRNLPGDVKYKSEYMDHNAENVRVLVLGPSSLSMGVKPACFDLQPAFSCAMGAQNFQEDDWIFHRYYDRMDSLKVLVLNYSGYDFTMAKNQTRDQIMGVGNPSREKKYRIYYDCPYYSGLEYEYEITGGLSASLRNIIVGVVNNDDEVFLTIDKEDGYQSRYFVNFPYNEAAWKDAAAKVAASSFTDATTLVPNAEYISKVENIIQKCQEKDILVVLVGAPLHPFLYEMLNQDVLAFNKELALSTIRKYDNVKIFDGLNGEGFTHKEMYNVNHLNTKGAMKFTTQLNDSINLWLGK